MIDLPPVFLTRRRFLATSTAALLLAGRARSAEPIGMPPLGICRSIEEASLAQAAGLSFLEVNLKSTCAPTVSEPAFEEWLQKVRDSSLPVSRANGFLPGDLKLVGPERDSARLQDYVELSLARANRTGIKIVTLGSGESRHAPEGTTIQAAVEQFTEASREIAKIAQRHDVTIAVEPLNRSETNLLNRLGEVCAVVDAVNAPNFGATADIYHMRRENEGAEALVAAGARVRHCHLAEDKDRLPPGSAGDDFTSYFSALKTIGYQGKISLECRWDDLPAQLPVAVTEVSAQWRRSADHLTSSHG